MTQYGHGAKRFPLVKHSSNVLALTKRSQGFLDVFHPLGNIFLNPHLLQTMIPLVGIPRELNNDCTLSVGEKLFQPDLVLMESCHLLQLMHTVTSVQPVGPDLSLEQGTEASCCRPAWCAQPGCSLTAGPHETKLDLATHISCNLLRQDLRLRRG